MMIFSSQTCLYPSCSEEGINAHAISKRISLEAIAENKHVLHFSPRQQSKEIKVPKFQKISINKATASKAFCKKHDELFNLLDDKEITNIRHALLQLYRSVCVSINKERESLINLYKLNSPEAYLAISKEEAIHFLNKNNKQDLITKLNNPNLLAIIQKKIHFQISCHLEDKLIETEAIANHLLNLVENTDETDIPFNQLINLTAKNLDYIILCYKTDFQIPVAINWIHKSTVGNYYSIVVPYANSSIILTMLPLILFKPNFVDNIELCFSSKLKVVEYVESIISTSDGWYIKPSIINNMEANKRKLLLLDCMFLNERKPFRNYELSIFDNLKRQVANDDEKLDLEDSIFSIPPRDSLENRVTAMYKALDSSGRQVFDNINIF